MKHIEKTTNQTTAGLFVINRTKMLICICLTGCALLFSCGEDDIAEALGFGCDGDWEAAYDTYYTDISEAATAYSTNPTTENCNAYKQSVERYINAIDDLEDCYPGQYEGDWDEYIEEAREELNSLCD